MATQNTTETTASRLNCFIAGTLIHTLNGLVPIENIRAGDKVLSYDTDVGQVEYQSVVQIYRNVADVFLKITVADEQEPIQVTLGHPFYVHHNKDDLASDDDEGEWILSKDLRVGDLLKLVSGEWKPILDTQVVRDTLPTYNFEVEKNHDYFVGQGGWLVHNQSNRARFEVGPNGVAIPTSKTELVNSLKSAGLKSYTNTRSVAETGTNFINSTNGNIYRVMDGSSVNPARLITHYAAGQGPITPWGAPIPPGVTGNAVKDITHFLLSP